MKGRLSELDSDRMSVGQYSIIWTTQTIQIIHFRVDVGTLKCRILSYKFILFTKFRNTIGIYLCSYIARDLKNEFAKI